MARTGLIAAMGMVVLALGLAAPARAGLPPLAPEALCASEIAKSEQLYGIPARLLDSISVVESGRYDRDSRATLAWPWTVTSEGEGKFFPTKAEAVAEVKRLKAKGVRNIDVGCMQVNLHYHPDAFSSIEDAFEPTANVGYAARFLKGLYNATNHWVTAASYYHSQTPALAAAYRDRLLKVWNGSGTSTAVAAAPAPSSKARSQVASLPPGKATPPITPAPSHPRVQEMREAWKTQVASAREEARRIADAYRQARLAEYQLRRERMAEARRAVGLAPSGY
ncbi:MAG: transglycosylase SLT domain-containing protein [Solirubrobacterales bacterium]